MALFNNTGLNMTGFDTTGFNMTGFNMTGFNTTTCDITNTGAAEDSTVSWQSAWWGLFPLALNNIVQDVGTPTLKVGNGVITRQLLRLSPFYCIIEAVWMLYCFAVIWLENRGSTTKAGQPAQSATLWERIVLAWQQTTKTADDVLKRSGVKGDSEETLPVYARIIPIFLALSQLVKLSGMQGIPFTNFCAWSYFSGYLVVEVLRAAAGKKASNPVPTHTGWGMWTTARHWASGIVDSAMKTPTKNSRRGLQGPSDLPFWESAAIRLRAIGEAVRGNSLDAQEPRTDHLEPSEAAKRRVAIVLLVTALGFAVQAIVMFVLLYRLMKLVLTDHNPILIYGLPRATSLKTAAGISIASSIKKRQYTFALLWGVVYCMYPSYLVGFDAFWLTIFAYGLFIKASGLVGSFVMSIPILASIRQRLGIATPEQWFIKSTAAACVAVVFAHYVVIYNPEGTFKPDWAEQLG